jgi:hypothetical protein
MRSFFALSFQNKIIRGLLCAFLLQVNAGWMPLLAEHADEDSIAIAAIEFLKNKEQQNNSDFQLNQAIASLQTVVKRLNNEICTQEQISEIYTELHLFLNELNSLKADFQKKQPAIIYDISNDHPTIDDIAGMIYEICRILNSMQSRSINSKEEDFQDFDIDKDLLSHVVYRAICVQNRILIILTTVQSIQSMLDACCTTLESKIDNLVVAATCDFSTVFTAIAKVDNDVNACCTTLESLIDGLSNVTVSCDFSTVFTAIAKVDNDVLSVSSKIDKLTNIINLDFNGTFTTLAALPSGSTTNLNGTYTAIAALSNQITNEFNGTFTALNACCATINSEIAALTNIVNLDFNGTFTTLAALPAGSTTNLNGTYTAIAALSNQITNEFNGTFTALNACCSTINSEIAALTNIVNLDFNGTFTTLAALPSGSTTNLNGTYTAIAALSNQITNEFNGTFTALNACCATINSEIAALTNIVNLDFNGTFTTLAALPANITSNLSGTYTAIAALSNQVTNEFNGTFTALNACCTTINSEIAALTNIVNLDFNGTFTTLANVVLQDSLILSKLAIIDTNVDTLLGDFNQTWTILGAINFTLNSRLDIITTDLVSCCTVIGLKSDVSVDCSLLTGTAQIDAAQLSVISWLKTIYRDIRGFANCP